ncbi:sugar ABC transporter ATP-binding protein [Aerococcaceae bacterium zg-BR22]|uniref:sugar ABC transporter ATP-binding protein n=1 Tax=Aerococcaceae bacterium zg-1292 TaxID=2774330 RepID=UPI00406281CE|nr:sugar ABC transporter ATP-binding protein [Aerococcaceae bacterium zg-BR22]
MSSEKIIELRHITKTFPGVKALEDVSIDIFRGEVHALAGENGAGKSTLLNILHGIYSGYEGSVIINGEETNFISANDAISKGIVKVHQEVSLVPELSIGQNIVLGYEKTKFGFVNEVETHKEVNKILERLNCRFKSEELAKNLDIADLQMASIAKALYHKAKILSLDEPTASLSVREKESLFKVINDLKNQGITIIYISHHLEEILEICDTITILRDGKKINTFPSRDVTKEELIHNMVGRNVELYERIKNSDLTDNVLEVVGMTRKGKFTDISFVLKRGEILGFSGLVGSSRTDVMRAIVGADKIDSGEILINGKSVKITSPEVAARHGIGLVPENRKTQGFIKNFDNKTNIAVPKISSFLERGLLNFNRIKENSSKFGKKIKLYPNAPDGYTVNLSGGNQQKVVISKWLSADVDVLILDEPTKGVDVGAKREIYEILNELTKLGKSIIVVSSELPEVLSVCDRVIVMKDGRIVITLENTDLSEAQILKYAMEV